VPREAFLVRVLLAALLFALSPLLGSGASAEPVDLLDPTPRWVEVAFEVSPRDLPAQTDTVYSQKIPARLEVGAKPGQVVVTVGRDHVESVLFAAGDPVPGSFSDFVWVFDAATGEVVSASLDGTVTEELDWGFFHTRTRTHIESKLATHRIGGVKRARRWLGQQLFEFCDDSGDERCKLVAGRRYDAATGYVYAVGSIEVGFSEVKLRTFSPLGEAIFSESEAMDASTLVARSEGSEVPPPLSSPGSVAAPALAPTPAVSAGPPRR
jgi:hypothetical protein